MEFATSGQEAQVEELNRVSNSVRLTVLAAKSEDYITATRHFQW